MNRAIRCLPGLLALLGLLPGALLAQQSVVPDWFLRLRLPNAAAVHPHSLGVGSGVRDGVRWRRTH